MAPNHRRHEQLHSRVSIPESQPVNLVLSLRCGYASVARCERVTSKR